MPRFKRKLASYKYNYAFSLKRYYITMTGIHSVILQFDR